MTQTQHTKGPWKAIYDEQENDWDIEVDGDRWNGIAPGIDREEDARLIAAAPDLLEALEIYMAAENQRIPIQGTGFITKARAAIAKAKGGSA